MSLCEARQGFAPSPQRHSDGADVLDQRRTSSSCPMLWPLMAPEERLAHLPLGHPIRRELVAVTAVAHRCAQVIEVDQERIEPLQLVRYLPGQRLGPRPFSRVFGPF